jgi:tetratricopeptide (TPR) repeat protein
MLLARAQPEWSWRVRTVAGGMAIGAFGLIGWFAWSAHQCATLWSAAVAAREAGDWEHVESALGRRAWYRPTDRDAIKLRVEAALQTGNRSTAERLLAAVPDSSDLAESAHLLRGRILKELYRPAEAIDELRACLRLNAQQAEAYRQLILIFGIERRAREQEAQLWALHDQGGAAIEALRMLAQPIPIIPPGALAKDIDEGLVLRRCLDTRPDDLWLRAPLAYFLRNRGQVAEARSLLQPWLQSSRVNPEMRLEDLACSLDLGEVNSKASWFERPDEQLGTYGRYWLLRGDWLCMQDRRTEALDSYREAIRRDPRSGEAHYRLAQTLREAGFTHEANEAIATHERLSNLSLLAARISENQPDPSLLAQAGRLCHDLNRDREARGWYTAVLRVAPSHAEARRFLRLPDLSTKGQDDETAAGQRTRDPQS